MGCPYPPPPIGGTDSRADFMASAALFSFSPVPTSSALCAPAMPIAAARGKASKAVRNATDISSSCFDTLLHRLKTDDTLLPLCAFAALFSLTWIKAAPVSRRAAGAVFAPGSTWG